MTVTHFPSDELSSDADQPGIHRYHCATDTVLIENRDVFLRGFYVRTEVNLVIITPDGERHLVEGYYLREKPPALGDGRGMVIPGEAVARFAGPTARGRYAETAYAATLIRIGQVRSICGTVSATQADGTLEPLKAGDPLYLNDVIETNAGSTIGLVLIDGTTVALGEHGQLVLDEFLYDRKTRGGNAVISLISGVAEFISGQIAKSGADHMMFKTPVGSIGIRGTKVFVAYNSDSGNVTIINRPTDSGADDITHAGEIVLFLPDGTPVGPITAANGSWHWNPRQRHAPTEVQLTEAQAHNTVAAVENLVNAVTP